MNIRLCLPLSLLLLTLPRTGLAQADVDVGSLARQLAQAEEPERRAEAARALGASDEPEALAPLCAALEDASASVREAAAQGLEKLEEPEGLECLRARKGEEEARVRVALGAARKALERRAAQRPRMYVAFPEMKDVTERSLEVKLLRQAEARLRRKLRQQGALLAPEAESPEAAKKLLRKHKIKGFELRVEVRPVGEEGLRLSVLCLRYPGQSLLANIGVQATGGEPEDQLEALVPRVIEEVADTLEWGR